MNKPYIVCHMMTSVDGRIDCAMTEHLPGVQEYYDTLDALDAATVKSLLQESNPAVPEELRSQQNLYRLVQPNEWYVAFTTQASQWKIGKGETCGTAKTLHHRQRSAGDRSPDRCGRTGQGRH